MAYSFEQVFAADPSNPANVARNAAVTIFAPGDIAKTPLTLTTPNGDPLANPLQVNNNGFGSAFMHATLDRVAWAGGNFTGFFTSYEGMKAEAVAARTAAQTAASTAGADAAAVATAAIGTAADDAEAAATSAAAAATAAANSAALVGAPADAAIAAAINGTGTATKTALSATIGDQIEAALADLPSGGDIRMDALAAGQRLRAVTAGNQTETAKGVTVGAMHKQTDLTTTAVSLGAVTLTQTGSLATTATPHKLTIGQPISLGTITTTTGISANDVYYVLTTPTATTFTFSGNAGGGVKTFTGDGTAANLYRRERAYDLPNVRVNPALRVTESRAVQADAGYPRRDYIKADPTIVTYAPGILTGAGMRVETEFDGQHIDIQLRNGGNVRARITVDGLFAYQVTSADFTTAAVSGGGIGRLPISFVDARKRSIAVEFDSPSDEFPGFDIQAGYSLAYPTGSTKGARVLIEGDSLTEHTGAGSSPGYTRWLAWHMGWKDVWKAGSGSTGYIADGTRLALIDRYTNDIINQQAQIVIIAMGINDATAYGADPASVIAAAETIWDATLASSYTKELVIVGPWPNGGGNGTILPSLLAMDVDLHALALEKGVRYISPISEGWKFTVTDGTHPDPAGHEYIGWRLAGHLTVPYIEAA